MPIREDTGIHVHHRRIRVDKHAIDIVYASVCVIMKQCVMEHGPSRAESFNAHELHNDSHSTGVEFRRMHDSILRPYFSQLGQSMHSVFDQFV